MKIYIIDVGNSKVVPLKGTTEPTTKKVKVEKRFVLLIETGKVDSNSGMPLYSISTLTEPELIAAVQKTPNAETINFCIENGRVRNKRKDASLSRFNQVGYGTKPYVVLAEIHSNDGTMLGYLFSTNNGYTYMRKTNDFLEDCERLMQKATANAAARGAKTEDYFKPVQNMKFMSKTSEANKTGKSYLAIYNEANPLPVMVLVSKKNTYAKPAAEPTKQNKKPSSKKVLESIYTPEQIAELRAAKAAGVDTRIISNPKLSPGQMHEIWTVESMGFKARAYADPAYSEQYMKFLGISLRSNANIEPVLNPKYNQFQAIEILRGIQLGLDVNKYANPDIDADEMHSLRLALEDDIWGFQMGGTASGKLRVMKQLS